MSLLFSHIIEDGDMNVSFSEDALAFLYDYDWPGNVRQLKALLQRANLLNQDKVITKTDLIRMLDHHKTPAPAPVSTYAEHTANEAKAPVYSSLEEAEKGMIIKAIRDSGMNISKAAAALGISRRTLYNKIAKYKINITHSVNL